MSELMKEVVNAAIWPAVLIMMSLIVFVTAMLLNFLSEKVKLVKDANKRTVLEQIVTLAGQKVLMTEQTIIHNMKEDVASGKISGQDLPALLSYAKDQTIEAVKRDASAMGLWELAAQHMGDATKVKDWVADVIESQVVQLPAAGLKAVTPAAPAGNLVVPMVNTDTVTTSSSDAPMMAK
jgi:hypothetical protein